MDLLVHCGQGLFGCNNQPQFYPFKMWAPNSPSERFMCWGLLKLVVRYCLIPYVHGVTAAHCWWREKPHWSRGPECTSAIVRPNAIVEQPRSGRVWWSPQKHWWLLRLGIERGRKGTLASLVFWCVLYLYGVWALLTIGKVPGTPTARCPLQVQEWLQFLDMRWTRNLGT